MSVPFEEVVDPIALEIVDWGAAAEALLSLESATYVCVEGSAVRQLRKDFSDSLVDRRVSEAALFSTLKSRVATFRKSPELVDRLVPLLSKDDWSIFHLNLHDAGSKLVEGYDWGMGCCPVSLAGTLRAQAAGLIAAGIAKPWPDEED